MLIQRYIRFFIALSNLTLANSVFAASIIEETPNTPNFSWEQSCTPFHGNYKSIDIARLESWQEDAICLLPDTKFSGDSLMKASLIKGDCHTDRIVFGYDIGEPFSDCAFAELNNKEVVSVELRPDGSKSRSAVNGHTDPGLGGFSVDSKAKGSRIVSASNGQNGRFFYISDTGNQLGVLDIHGFSSESSQTTSTPAPSDVAGVPWSWSNNDELRKGELIAVVSKKQNTLRLFFLEDKALTFHYPEVAITPEQLLVWNKHRFRSDGNRDHYSICDDIETTCHTITDVDFAPLNDSELLAAINTNTLLNDFSQVLAPQFELISEYTIKAPDNIELALRDNGTVQVYVTSKQTSTLSMFSVPACGSPVPITSIKYDAPDSLAVLGLGSHEQVFIASASNNTVSVYQAGEDNDFTLLSSLHATNPRDIAVINDNSKPVLYLATSAGVLRYRGSTTKWIDPATPTPKPITSSDDSFDVATFGIGALTGVGATGMIWLFTLRHRLKAMFYGYTKL